MMSDAFPKPTWNNFIQQVFIDSFMSDIPFGIEVGSVQRRILLADKSGNEIKSIVTFNGLSSFINTGYVSKPDDDA